MTSLEKCTLNSVFIYSWQMHQRWETWCINDVAVSMLICKIQIKLIGCPTQLQQWRDKMPTGINQPSTVINL